VTTVWKLLPAALLAASALAGAPAAVAAVPDRDARVLLVLRVRDTVTLACVPGPGGIVACTARHRPRACLTAGPGPVTGGPDPLGPLPRAPRPRTPASGPALP
jgi:hypothetical protein